MIILCIRTDKPEAELYLYKNQEKLVEIKWLAHRELAASIHKQIEKLLMLQGLPLQQIEGVIVFKGPGSFTGLRIGLTVANALAFSLNIPIVASRGNNWIIKGIKSLKVGKNDKIAVPYYGRPANVSLPKK